MTVSALLAAGLITAGSSGHSHPTVSAAAPIPHLARAPRPTVGLVTADPAPQVQQLERYGTIDPAPAPTIPIITVAQVDLSFSGALDIPRIAMAAYRNAEQTLAETDPACGVSWPLLAGIGKVESGHADGGRTDATGTTITPILGPALDGHLPDNAVIRAGDGNYVRAVGPMQFLPGTWNYYAADALGDGTPDPNNIFDAALAAGKYLCSGGLNLREPSQQLTAVLRYNNSPTYAATVLGWAAAYQAGKNEIETPAVTIPRLPKDHPPEPPAADQPPIAPATPPQTMITIPGLPPIPCGIFCPPPPPAPPAAAPTPAPKPTGSGAHRYARHHTVDRRTPPTQVDRTTEEL